MLVVKEVILLCVFFDIFGVVVGVDIVGIVVSVVKSQVVLFDGFIPFTDSVTFNMSIVIVVGVVFVYNFSFDIDVRFNRS